MTKVLVFGGTSEEHALLDSLSDLQCSVTLCVASEYGKSLLKDKVPNVTVRTSRLDRTQMAEKLLDGGFACVIDATHPYAVEVTKNARAAAQDTGTPYFRLRRESSDLRGVTTVASVHEAAKRLTETDGNVLLTTGSKELAAFTVIPEYEKRLYPRVLPAVESIEACLALGFQSSHIIALQGPMSKELNIALMRQFNIQVLVTKDGGVPGGVPEKLEAARDMGAAVIVVRRPDDDGMAQNEIILALRKLLEVRR